MTKIQVALCQVNTVVGDLAGNTERIIDAVTRAEEFEADVVAFPELSITGYPPEDLLLKPGFVQDNLYFLEQVAAAVNSCAVVVGFVDSPREERSTPLSKGSRQPIYNAAAVCSKGEVVGVYHKRLLPNYGVFDEKRYFAQGKGLYTLYKLEGSLVGISICEDLWFPNGPVLAQAKGGASLVININASPYSVGRLADRLAVLRERVQEANCHIAYVNQVGGQDELVFDGGSMVVSPSGDILGISPQFEEDMLVVDLHLEGGSANGHLDASAVHLVDLGASTRGTKEPILRGIAPSDRGIVPSLSREEEIYKALVLGTKDYVRKNGFKDVVIGLSGGIDSSLVATIATDALGAQHVHGVAMPSRYSSQGSITDAQILVKNLGIDLHIIPIESVHQMFADVLAPVLGNVPTGLTDENLQSRIRGIILMALSNANGWLVLTTGNKSELATGYSTLYGDSVGGFGVIKDVLKTVVYSLCRYRNSKDGREIIPESILLKPPSAELREGQIDEQSLPPYDLLDPVLQGYVEQDHTAIELVELGFDSNLVHEVVHLVDSAEYKRRQMPPGVRITMKAFGKDRRMPITNLYKERAQLHTYGKVENK